MMTNRTSLRQSISESNRSLSRTLLPCLVAVLIYGSFSLGTSNATEPLPNVVLILCDDLGYGDLACYGHPKINTPHLDGLAEQGLRLTSCYAAAPVCSSSRAGLLTGRNPNRSGIYDWLPNGIPVYLRTSEPTVPGYLKRAGYRTALIGKWHLNGQFNQRGQPQPDEYGFDHWMATQNNAAPSHAQPVNFVRNGNPVGKLKGYSCEEVAGETVRWIESVATSDAPFYAHVCFHEPHEPVESPPDLVESYLKSAANRDEAHYFANVTNMDAAVGEILAALERLELADNTLVIFTSDNGPETLNRYRGADRSYGSPGPLREMKLHIYEGGIRVPGIIRWPAVIDAGRTDDTPVGGVDVLPTLCEIAGVQLDTAMPTDGVSFVPLLKGRSLRRQRPLHWMYYRALTAPRFAIRDGRWKLVASWDGGATSATGRSVPGRNINPAAIDVIKTAELSDFQLYDLQSDIDESENLAERRPDVLRRLRKQATEIHSEIQNEAPRWPETGDFWSGRN